MPNTKTVELTEDETKVLLTMLKFIIPLYGDSPKLERIINELKEKLS